MSKPASSFPAERAVKRWYREPWPWALFAGPLVVVVASLASAWMAIKSDDGVVREDYYKQGLLINRKLERADAINSRPLGAIVRVALDGEVRVRVEGLADVPKNLRLKLAQPATAATPRIVILTLGPDGEYVGALAEQTAERWIVTLESDAWSLPTTTVAGRLGEVRLGTAERS
jgi:hypothetical protein